MSMKHALGYFYEDFSLENMAFFLNLFTWTIINEALFKYQRCLSSIKFETLLKKILSLRFEIVYTSHLTF